MAIHLANPEFQTNSIERTSGTIPAEDGTWTISFKFRLDTDRDTWGCILGIGDNAGNDISLFVGGDGTTLTVYDDGGSTTGTALTVGQVYHVFFDHGNTSNQTRIWLDNGGTADIDRTGTGGTHTRMDMGVLGTANQDPSDLVVYDFIWWDTVLTAEERTIQYAARRPVVQLDNLMQWNPIWGSGGLEDWSGNGRAWTSVGGTDYDNALPVPWGVSPQLISIVAASGAITGTADFNLPTLSITGVGNLPIDGAADFNLPVTSVTGVGNIPVAGLADFNLPVPSVTGIGGGDSVVGAADFNLPTLALTGIGNLPIAGLADFNLPTLALTGIGNLPITGLAGFNLPVPSIIGIGDLPIAGAASFNLPTLDLTAIGTVGASGTVNGIADFNLPTLALTGRGGVNIDMVSIYSITGQTGADTGAAVIVNRSTDPFRNRNVLVQTVLSAGTATILIEGSLDGGSSWDLLTASATASEMVSVVLPPRIRVRLSAATGATVNVYLDADRNQIRSDS